MRILQVDTHLVKEPQIVITCAANKNIDRIIQNMLQSGSASQQQQQQQKKRRLQQQHYVTVVTDEKNDMVAVDYIEVLQAAKKAKIPKIPVLLLGRKDPMRTHISLQSVKSMANPIRIGQALHLGHGRHCPNAVSELVCKDHLAGGVRRGHQRDACRFLGRGNQKRA